MEILNCTPADLPQIKALYQAARDLQKQQKMVVWPAFEDAFLQKEIAEGRQWKIVQDGEILCNWAITFRDQEIWEARDQDDAIYIHRICTNPRYRGNRHIDQLVSWAIPYAKSLQKQYVRLDTLGDNTTLIRHYTSAGFEFLGMFRLTNTATLPKHYQDEPNCCLFQLSVAEAG